MSKVCCAGCGTYGDKEAMVPFGLGWCCDVNCRSDASRRRRPRSSSNAAGRGNQGPSPGTRRSVKTRDGQRCRFCGSANSLAIHHVKYRSEGGTHDERNLLTLCLECHATVHSNKYRYQPVLLELLRLHYEEQRFMAVLQVERLLTQRPTPPINLE